MTEGARNTIVAFFSYTRADDRARRDRLSYIRGRLEEELRVVSGDHTLEVFQDTDDIALGEDWDEALSRALGEAVFFIPMLTPSYFQSEPCLTELERFRRRERELGRNDLIMPVYWQTARSLQSPEGEAETFLASRQWEDWRQFSLNTIEDSKLDDAILGLAQFLEERLNGLRGTAGLVETPPGKDAGPGAGNGTPPGSHATSQETPAPARPAVQADWPSGAGEDEHGRFVELTYGDLTQRLRWCPPGRFLMGSPKSEEGRSEDEGPQTEIVFEEGFWLFETAVTRALYDAVMGQNQSGVEGAARPVETVSWEDAQAFVASLNGAIEGLGLVLPSEAQWEYACRAGSATPFEPNVARRYGGGTATTDEVNYDGTYPMGEAGKGAYREATVSVSGPPFRPNAWGLWHMHGNVWEWCADVWHTNHEGASRVGAPRQLGEHESGERHRVVRGGSWLNYARFCRAAARSGLAPDERRDYLGFRPARGRGSGPGR